MKIITLMGMLLFSLTSWAGDPTPTISDRDRMITSFEMHEAGDYGGAINIWVEMAERGIPDAQYLLGLVYATVGDHQNSLQWFLVSQQLAQSKVEIGLIYEFGLGTPVDTELAFQWYSSAATQHEPQAQYRLALMYERGFEHLTPNLSRALNLAEKSYAGGHQPAKQLRDRLMLEVRQ